ncbi:tRNA pseudouridine(38-40) synthase TruA [Litoribrevibacter euphylliae]|uniref:tRNA pseudouridine synthase A n=1 Tax=Litoribrevibacter euphylliae TaxID=1834034 RepID=A0ABV7H764_9GAMM
MSQLSEHPIVERIALGIEYFGHGFKGWQRQPSAKPSIQEELEKALSRIANLPIEVVCAGRTDAGVHATHQVVHFDSPVVRNDNSWVRGVNSQLPDQIGVKWVTRVDDTFHARFSATARRYRYVIDNSSTMPVIHRNAVTWHFSPLDAQAMHDAGQALLGENDFTSFRAKECQSHTPMRNIHHLMVRRIGDLVVIDVKANAFLHHMIRNIAGVLCEVGDGRKPIEWVKNVLAAKDRTQASVTAPPHGLYFVDVDYDDGYGLPKGSRSLGPLLVTPANHLFE